MRRSVAGTLVVLLTCQLPARAEEHLVSGETVQARLNAAATERAENIAVLEVLLDTPEVMQACEAAGIRVARLKGQLTFLTDEELRDLSRRAVDLKTDPVAGMSTIGKVALIVVALLVILVVAAAIALRNID